MIVKPPEAVDSANLDTIVKALDPGRARERVRESIEPLLDAGQAGQWLGTAEQQSWQSLINITASSTQESYGKDLTEHLMSLMCKSRFANASVATGIAKRAQGGQFRGNISAINDRLRAKDCSASEAISQSLLQRLSTAVDTNMGR